MTKSAQGSDLTSAALWLRLQIEAGADCPIGPEPANRFARQKPSQTSSPIPTATASGATLSAEPPTPAGGGIAAAACQSLAELRQAMADFEGCALRNSATKLVFADGNPKARLMLLGEAPGRDEDRIGRPFVGESGRLLDRMLAAIGLTRDEVYITNIVPWRPPGNRAPSQEETTACAPFARRHIELVAPRLLVTLGGVAATTLLGESAGITRLRGRWFSYQAAGREIPVLPLFHPAYLLRQPALKRETWIDLLNIKGKLEALE